MGALLSISTRPRVEDAETRATPGRRPTWRSIRTSHERQVMPATGTVVATTWGRDEVGICACGGCMVADWRLPVRAWRRATAIRWSSSASKSRGPAFDADWLRDG